MIDDRVVDLFAGAGGWDVALTDLGYKPIGIELNDVACKAAVAAGHSRIVADVSSYPPEAFVGSVGLVASPPCTDFSMNGRRAGLAGKSGPLVWEPYRWVEIIRPEGCCFEQVPPVLGIWRAQAIKLRELGYLVWCGILNSADYGAPQNRQRAILVASCRYIIQPPQPTHCDGGREVLDSLFGTEPALAKWVTISDVLGWPHTWRLQRMVSENFANGRERQYRMATEPSFTITSGLSAFDVVMDGGERRNPTNRELGILQGFPPDYPWFGSRGAQNAQIANAIPPPLAKAAVMAVADRSSNVITV